MECPWKPKLSLEKGIHLAKTYDEFFAVQGTDISDAKKASPPSPFGAGPEDTEATLQSRDTPPPPYTQQSATQL
jgi:hypothetical protein